MAVPLDLEDKVVLVTGGAGDIGVSVVSRCAELGATVILVDNGTSVEGHGEDATHVEQTARKIAANGGSITSKYCDVSDPDQVEALLSDSFAEHGNIDVAVAAAGTLRVKPIWEMDYDDWRSVMESHASHTFLLAMGLCRRWKDNCSARGASRSRLINFTAATGLVGRPDLGVAHSAAKGAVAALSLELAHEMFPYGVSVNAIAASNVRGRMASHVNAYVPAVEAGFDPGSPEHTSALVSYLCSDEAAWVTGQVFRVMGGLIGRYQPWSVTGSLQKYEDWTTDDLRQGIPRLMGVFPEYKAIQGVHREF